MMTMKRGRDRRSWIGLLLVGSMGLACGDDENPDVPNRVLDRPVDLALTCVEIRCDEDDPEDCEAAALPVSACEDEGTACATTNAPHLLGAVANSERNELAFFQQCSGTLVDLDSRTPGYQFVPTGALPSAVVNSEDSCFVVSANAGSCDLSVVQTLSVASAIYGLDDDASALSSAVATVRPQRFDPDAGGWVPVGARLGAVLSVPTSLSSSPAVPGTSGADPTVCPLGRPRSVYVTFPTCDMVAEVDLNTQRILQSIQFEQDADGVWSAMDAGVSPMCAVDCAAQFELEEGESLPQGPPATLSPLALDLIRRPVQTSPDAPLDGADLAVEGQALLLGGQGSDVLFEIKMDDDGRWDADVNQLGLTRAGGIDSIHVAPSVDFDVDGRACDGAQGSAIDPHQFVYVIVGDGSTRVVDRDLSEDRTDIGIECDTQLDPALFVTTEPCVSVDTGGAGPVSLQQRQLAGSPGIISPSGGRFTDWTFLKKRGEVAGEESSSVPQIGTCGSVLGVGMTDLGGMVFSAFDQYQGLDAALGADEGGPLLTLLNPTLGTNALEAELPPVSPVNGVFGQWDSGSLNYGGLPRMEDAPLARQLGGDGEGMELLSPGLRLVDYAYTAAYSPSTRRSLLLGSITNVDGLADEDDLDSSTQGPLHIEPVVRPWVRDYRGWPNGTWQLQWEGPIPNTSSSSGLLACDQPGWEDVTCTPADENDARLEDASASFCDQGVLPGDKLVLIGCNSDENCGIGSICLQETAAGGESTGICVAADAVDEDPLLREACLEFISDPCGEAHREFSITRAFQSELWLQSLARPPLSYLVGLDPESPDDFGFDACDPSGPNVGSSCGSDDGCPAGSGLTCVLGECQCEARVQEVTASMTCAEAQPEGGCTSHEECFELLDDQPGDPNFSSMSVDGEGQPVALRNQDFFCVDRRCRIACEEGDDCLLRRLPGPRCFGEFVRYSVSARNAFVVDGPGVLDFFPDRVFADPDTSECVEPPGVSGGVSTLLNSRVPLGADLSSLGLEACPSGPPTSFSPNPCLVTTPRSDSALSAFHTFTYQGETVPAVRISTPVGTFMLDLVDLFSLGGVVPEQDGFLWPSEFATFNRARIRRGYLMEFGTVQSYAPFNIFGLSADGANPLYYPVRIVPSPDLTRVFVVDATGSGSQFGLRGQVLKVTVNGISTVADVLFDGVR